jgi:chemotaxis response regulator CheB
MPLRILVVDDNEAIRQAVRSCLELNTDWQVCGEAENGSIALDMVRELNPDVIVLGLALPGMNGLEVARGIAANALRTRMIMFTANDCEQFIKEAESAGISKVVAKLGGQHSRSSADSDETDVPRTRCRIARGSTSRDLGATIGNVLDRPGSQRHPGAALLPSQWTL